MLEEEIWKDISNYEGLYQISNLGNVKRLARQLITKRRVMNFKDIILKLNFDGAGYLIVNLYFNGKLKTKAVHRLVAQAFLNHTPCGHKLVVNHINHIKTDNRVENLEIVTNRENCNLKHIKSTSKYTGVCWHKRINKWNAQIHVNGKAKHLGYFIDEYDAHLAYERALADLLLKTNVYTNEIVINNQ